jgi:ubiquinol-cytochrome c reductase cytochrome c1 subunit
MHHAKNANGGLWPKDLTRAASHNPGNINYPYNLLTGYHYNPPFGLDVSEGRYFNPYYDHMIIGMPPQLHDGMIEYDDGTPSSAPQMAHDVSEYITYLQKSKYPDTKVLLWMITSMYVMFYLASYSFTKFHYINTYSYRFEVYAVKNGGYKKFRQKMFKTHKITGNWMGNYS